MYFQIDDTECTASAFEIMMKMQQFQLAKRQNEYERFQFGKNRPAGRGRVSDVQTANFNIKKRCIWMEIYIYTIDEIFVFRLSMFCTILN